MEHTKYNNFSVHCCKTLDMYIQTTHLLTSGCADRGGDDTTGEVLAGVAVG